MLLAAVALFAAGVLLGFPLLRAIAGFATGALAVAVVPLLGRLRPTVRRSVHPDRVQRGDTAVAELVVTNTTGSRQPAFLARDVVGGEQREIPVRLLPPGGAARYRYELPTGRRGRFDVGPLSVERSDVLGLARARGEIGQPAQLWVHPRRHPVRLLTAGRSRVHHEGEPPPLAVRGSMDLAALRDYVVGDELRHLHWKATARTGRLMVRQYVDPAQPWCVVLLDTRRQGLTPEAFEEAVEVAASVVWEACEQGRPVRWCTTGGARVDTPGGAAGARELLDRLCLVGQDDTVAIQLEGIGGARGDGWFVQIGGAGIDAAAVIARRFGTSVRFDLSGVGEVREHGGTPTIHAATARDAVRAWNGVPAR